MMTKQCIFDHYEVMGNNYQSSKLGKKKIKIYFFDHYEVVGNNYDYMLK